MVRRVDPSSWPPDQHPIPYVCSLTHSRSRKPDAIAVATREFVWHASQELSGTKPRNRRERHLLALPLLATGFAGMRNKAGSILNRLLPELERLVIETKMDIVLVLWEQPIYSMVQAYRKDRREDSFPCLSPADRMKADELAEFAHQGVFAFPSV